MVSRNKNQLIRRIIFITGFLLCCYPLVSSMIEGQVQTNAISTYVNDVSALDDSKIKSDLHQAEKYNDVLYQTWGATVGNSNEILSDQQYQQLLNPNHTGIMGTIEIPKINVYLPIYHGTDDDVLSKGIGHVRETSLPIGGLNTRSLLTGHRGLPTSKLFTRLDELTIDDFFFIHIYNQTLAYQVNEIIEIKPEEVEQLTIIPDQDLISLITCTPYGINTHRLVVTAKRVEYNQKESENIPSAMMSNRELLFTLLPFIFLLLVLYLIIKDRKELT